MLVSSSQTQPRLLQAMTSSMAHISSLQATQDLQQLPRHSHMLAVLCKRQIMGHQVRSMASCPKGPTYVA